MNRIERIRTEVAQLQAATLAARLRLRLLRMPDDTRLRRQVAAMEAVAPRSPLRLPGLPGLPNPPCLPVPPVPSVAPMPLPKPVPPWPRTGP